MADSTLGRTTPNASRSKYLQLQQTRISTPAPPASNLTRGCPASPDAKGPQAPPRTQQTIKWQSSRDSILLEVTNLAACPSLGRDNVGSFQRCPTITYFEGPKPECQRQHQENTQTVEAKESVHEGQPFLWAEMRSHAKVVSNQCGVTDSGCRQRCTGESFRVRSQCLLFSFLVCLPWEASWLKKKQKINCRQCWSDMLGDTRRSDVWRGKPIPLATEDRLVTQKGKRSTA